jgi:hypothetical protein
MNRCLALLTTLLLLAGCRTSGAPDHTSRLETSPDGSLTIHVDSDSMTEEEVRRTLLIEAARATIERGGIYLRIEEITDASSLAVRNRQPAETTPEPPAATPENPGAVPMAPAADPAARTEMTVRRESTGRIRFTVLRERAEGERVFDASRLMDDVHSGKVPAL